MTAPRRPLALLVAATVVLTATLSGCGPQADEPKTGRKADESQLRSKSAASQDAQRMGTAPSGR